MLVILKQGKLAFVAEKVAFAVGEPSDQLAPLQFPRLIIALQQAIILFGRGKLVFFDARSKKTPEDRFVFLADMKAGARGGELLETLQVGRIHSRDLSSFRGKERWPGCPWNPHKLTDIQWHQLQNKLLSHLLSCLKYSRQRFTAEFFNKPLAKVKSASLVGTRQAMSLQHQSFDLGKKSIAKARIFKTIFTLNYVHQNSLLTLQI